MHPKRPCHLPFATCLSCKAYISRMPLCFVDAVAVAHLIAEASTQRPCPAIASNESLDGIGRGVMVD